MSDRGNKKNKKIVPDDGTNLKAGRRDPDDAKGSVASTTIATGHDVVVPAETKRSFKNALLDKSESIDSSKSTEDVGGLKAKTVESKSWMVVIQEGFDAMLLASHTAGDKAEGKGEGNILEGGAAQEGTGSDGAKEMWSSDGTNLFGDKDDDSDGELGSLVNHG